MNQDMQIHQSFRQRPWMSPGVVHSMQLLSMPYTALIPFLSRMTLENPLLEMESSAEDIPLDLVETEQEGEPLKSGNRGESLPGQESLRQRKRFCAWSCFYRGIPGR